MLDKYEQQFYKTCFLGYEDEALSMGKLVALLSNISIRPTLLIDYFNREDVRSIIRSTLKDFRTALQEHWDYVESVHLTVVFTLQDTFFGLTKRTLATKLYSPATNTEKELTDLPKEQVLGVLSVDLLAFFHCLMAMEAALTSKETLSPGEKTDAAN